MLNDQIMHLEIDSSIALPFIFLYFFSNRLQGIILLPYSLDGLLKEVRFAFFIQNMLEFSQLFNHIILLL